MKAAQCLMTMFYNNKSVLAQKTKVILSLKFKRVNGQIYCRLYKPCTTSIFIKISNQFNLLLSI